MVVSTSSKAAEDSISSISATGWKSLEVSAGPAGETGDAVVTADCGMVRTSFMGLLGSFFLTVITGFVGRKKRHPLAAGVGFVRRIVESTSHGTWHPPLRETNNPNRNNRNGAAG